MIKDSNVQKSIVIPKVISDKIQKEAEDSYISFNAVIKKILIEYYKNKK